MLLSRHPAWAASALGPLEGKQTDVAGHHEMTNHLGLLSNEAPGEAGCSLFSRPTNSSARDQTGVTDAARGPFPF